MKILIGTPIHEVKDYCLERWLKNVSSLQKVYPADLLLVDNSLGLEYAEKVKGYCAKYGINPVKNLGQSPISNGVKNYKIVHLEINQGLGEAMRIEMSQETIRQYVLSHDYDAWFSWECDQIIPANALDKLLKIMKMGNFNMVVHNSWARWDTAIVNMNMGVTLIKQECLKKNRFLPKRGGKISTDISDSYDIHTTEFKRRILKSGGNFIDVYGIISPIYHLNQ